MSKIKFSLQPDTGTLSEQDAKRYFSTIGIAACILIAVSSVGSILLFSFVMQVFPSLLENEWIYSLLSITPTYIIALPIFALFLRRLPRDSVQPERMGGKNFFFGFCVACLFVLVGNYIGNAFSLIFEQALGRPQTNPVNEMTEGQPFLINLVFMSILPAIFEELAFRKALCSRLLPLGEGYAVVISAAVFALIHGNFFQVFYAFLVGLLLSYVYVRTGRIRYSLAYHLIINLLFGVLLPWLMDQLAPMLTVEWLTELESLMTVGDAEGVLAMMTPFAQPLFLLMLFEGFIVTMVILGIITLATKAKKIRLHEGLLPPPKEGRIANVFLNGGVFLAIAAFSVLFVLSLL